MAKIFVRERNKISKGDKQPRFAVVGVAGTDLTFFQLHLRMSELDTIAKAVGAELLMLPRGSGENAGDGKGKGGGKKATTKKRAQGGHAPSA
jgi:hypothetical protein